MFAYISWEILSQDGISCTCLIEGTWLWLELLVSPSLIANIRIWEKISFWIHHHINDAGQTLFGFSTLEEKLLFRQLLKVNGIGGKTALSLLGLWNENLLKAIQFEDDTLLSSVPGIGKKTAQKIIVDLKWSIDFTKHAAKSSWGSSNSWDILLISSLTQMGYDKTKVEEIVSGLDSHASIEIRTIEAIKLLSR